MKTPELARDAVASFAPAQGSAAKVRCRVACEWREGGGTLRYSESRDWSSEEAALNYAAGCHRSGKYTSIRVRYSRKRRGRWSNSGSVPYLPNP